MNLCKINLLLFNGYNATIMCCNTDYCNYDIPTKTIEKTNYNNASATTINIICLIGLLIIILKTIHL
jgi:hypothetical protein